MLGKVRTSPLRPAAKSDEFGIGPVDTSSANPAGILSPDCEHPEPEAAMKREATGIPTIFVHSDDETAWVATLVENDLLGWTVPTTA